MVVTAEKDIQGALDAGQCVRKVHESLVGYLRAGLTLPEVDAFVGKTLKQLDCTSAFHRYRIPGHPPFPSQSCLSVNECIVHGTHVMSTAPLESGDILSVDIGVKHKGWIGDAAWTYLIEDGDDEAKALLASGKESLRRGIEAMQHGRPLVDWARAVQEYVEGERGFHLVRGLGGHGYGRKLHGPPFLSNVLPTSRAEWPDAWQLFTAGSLIAVEPMLAVGTGAITSEPRKWPIFTADGSRSAHYEADVMITEAGPKNLTAGMEDLPDLVG